MYLINLSLSPSIAVWFSSTKVFIEVCIGNTGIFMYFPISKHSAAVPVSPALLHAPVQGSGPAGPRRRGVVAHPWPGPWVLAGL